MTIFEGLGRVSPSLLLPASIAAGGIVGGLLVKRALAAKPAGGLGGNGPEKWVKVGTIRELVIHPVKSMGGNCVDEAVVGKLGLQGTTNPLIRDRVFAVMDANNSCITQRQMPIFAQLVVKIEGDRISLSHSKNPSVSISVNIPTGGKNNVEENFVTILGERVRAVDCGDEVGAWLDSLGELTGLRMVYHLSEGPTRGTPSRNTRFHTYRKDDIGSFQDETSYMLMTDESLAALNAHLEDKPVSHKNFRPSIIVEGIPEPFAEDFWGFIRIGGEGGPVLQGSRPCVRCNRTVVDPETAKMREDGEPLTTLYKIKRQVGDDKVSKMVSKAAVLGAHFGVFKGEGEVIRVGDPIYAALL